MFDGVLNSGLYITDHLQHGLQSKLPIHALTITAWFTISEATLNAGSLIAVQQEEGHERKANTVHKEARKSDSKSIGQVFTAPACLLYIVPKV